MLLACFIGWPTYVRRLLLPLRNVLHDGLSEACVLVTIMGRHADAASVSITADACRLLTRIKMELVSSLGWLDRISVGRNSHTSSLWLC